MSYERKMRDEICVYEVTEGVAYFVFVVLGGSGFRVDEVKAGDSWWEGYGEELVVIAESEEEAWDRINSMVVDSWTTHRN